MRCYNAAMSKPFQFSLRQMLVAVGLLCFAAWIGGIAFVYATNGVQLLLMVSGAGSLAGAAIGQLFRRPIVWAIVGGILTAYIAVSLGIGLTLPTNSGRSN
jgi:hypothetical protein